VNFRRSVIIAELWQPEVARRSTFSRNFCFFGTTIPYGKISKFCSESFHHNTNWCVQISWNLANRKSMKSCTACQSKNFAWLSSCRYCADHDQNLPGPAPDNVLKDFSRFHPNLFTFCGVLAKRANTATTRHNPVFGWSLASSWIKN